MKRKRKDAPPVEAAPLPHSWSFADWPAGVYPNNERRAKYLFRTAQRDLLAEGACARVGRTIVFFGDGYSRYLRKQAARVPHFEITANTNRPGSHDAAS